MKKREMRAWLKEEIESALARPCEVSNDGETKFHCSYLGSVMRLAPSGKYYTFWSSGNLEPCPRCKGKGVTNKEYECEYCKGSGTRIDGISKGDICRPCRGSGKVNKECTWCGGLGSREAWLDQKFWELLEETAEELGGWIENGEGDPTDVFVCIHCERCDEDEA